MKKIILITVIMVCILLSSCDDKWDDIDSNTQNLDGFFEDPGGLFSIRYNTNWDITTDRIIMFTNMKTIKDSERITVSILDMQLKPSPLSEYAEHIKIAKKEISSDFEILNSNELVHDSDDAYTMSYSFDYQEKLFTEMTFLKQKNNRIYIITYTALTENYDKQLSVVNKMIETFLVY